MNDKELDIILTAALGEHGMWQGEWWGLMNREEKLQILGEVIGYTLRELARKEK
jgi:hypothetical protein